MTALARFYSNGYLMPWVNCVFFSFLISGFIFDLTKTYAKSFIFAGGCCIVSSALVMVVVVFVGCGGVGDKVVHKGDQEIGEHSPLK